MQFLSKRLCSPFEDICGTAVVLLSLNHSLIIPLPPGLARDSNIYHGRQENMNLKLSSSLETTFQISRVSQRLNILFTRHIRNRQFWFSQQSFQRS